MKVMKPVIKKNFLQMLVIIMILFSPYIVIAQPTFEDDAEDTAAPIDGGISLVVAAGIGYGLKRAYNARSTKKNKD